MTTTSADLDHLAWLSDAVRAHQRDVRDAGEAAVHAVARFRADSGELVPWTADHAAATGPLADDLDELARDVDRTGERLAAADGMLLPPWLFGVGAYGRVTDGALAGDTNRLLALRDGRDATRMLHHVAGVVHEERRTRPPDGGRTWHDADVKKDLQRAPSETKAQYDARAKRERAARTARSRQARSAAHRLSRGFDDVLAAQSARAQIADSVADVEVLRHGANATGSSARTAVGRAVDAVRNSRVGAATRLGARVFGVVGIGLGVHDSVQSFRRRSFGDAAAAGASAAGGVLLMTGFPPAQVLGGVLVAGATVYEFRKEIAAGARTARRAVEAEVERRVAEYRATVELVGDLREGAQDFFDGLF